MVFSVRVMQMPGGSEGGYVLKSISIDGFGRGCMCVKTVRFMNVESS